VTPQAVANRRSTTSELILLLERNLDPQYGPAAAAPDKADKAKRGKKR
jgi:hypothetical protein